MLSKGSAVVRIYRSVATWLFKVKNSQVRGNNESNVSSYAHENSNAYNTQK